MKLIIAMIRPEKLEQVRHALDEADVNLMYAGEAQDVWRQTSCMYRGQEYNLSQPKIRLDILAVNDATVPSLVDAISGAAFESGVGLYGSGDIFVMPLDEWFPIRSGNPRFASRDVLQEETSNVR